MRKTMLSFLSVSVFALILLASCSGFFQQEKESENGSLSIRMPDDFSENIVASPRTASRAAEDSENQNESETEGTTAADSVKFSVYITGDWETSKEFESAPLDKFNGMTFTVEDIPADKEITVKGKIQAGDIIYSGSAEIKTKKGVNNIVLDLKKSSLNIGVEIAGFNLGCATRNSDGSYSLIEPFIKKNKGPYYVVPVKNDKPFAPESACTWKVDGKNVESSGSKPLLISKDWFNENKWQANIACMIGDEIQEMLISDISVNTDFVLHNIGRLNVMYCVQLESLSDFNNVPSADERASVALNNGHGYYAKSNSNKIEFFNKHGGNGNGNYDSNISLDDKIEEKPDLIYYDLQYRKLSTLKGNEIKTYGINGSDKKVTIQAITAADGNHKISKFAVQEKDGIYAISITDSTNADGDVVYIFKNEKNVKEIKIIDHVDFPYAKVTDMVILDDRLLVLAATNKYVSTIGQYPMGQYQNGILLSINLKDFSDIKGLGSSSNHFTENNGTTDITIYGNKDITALSFFIPTRIVAIKEDDIYIAETGAIYSEKKGKKISRISKVNLKSFALSVEEDFSTKGIDFGSVDNSCSFPN